MIGASANHAKFLTHQWIYEYDQAKKLKTVREKVKLSDGECHVMSSLDDAGSILNLRGNDSNNPSFPFSSAINTIRLQFYLYDCEKFLMIINKIFGKEKDLV